MSWAQSYPTQRIEGKDTVVVMTIKQAQDINTVFANQKSEIHKLNQDLQGMRSVADSLATDLFRTRIQLENTQKSLFLNQKNAEYTTRFQSQLMFGFWAAFVTYLSIFN